MALTILPNLHHVLRLYQSAAHTLLQTIRVSIVQRLLRSTDGRRIAVREFMIFDEDLKTELSEFPY
ncbi:hypothetical protein EWM58_02895 [Candidatus Erwinia dacicola]|nr:hypothetical protein [Candidatus Erwinia dacicola]NJC99404.1 hypothetical protein [Candidatus Erwinia dacicola]